MSQLKWRDTLAEMGPKRLLRTVYEAEMEVQEEDNQKRWSA